MSAVRRVRTPEWLTLGPGETVHVRAAPSKNLLLAAIAVGMTLLLVVSLVVAALGNIAMGRALSFAVTVFALALLVAIYGFVDRWEYAVTSDRACVARGFRSRERTVLPLDAVERVDVEQSHWQRVIDVGDIVFITDDDALRFVAVEDPRRVHEQVAAALGSADV